MNCEETTRKDLAGEEPAETLPAGEPAPEAAASLPEENGPEPADDENTGESEEAAGWLVRLRQKLPEGPGGRLIAWLILVAAALLVLVGSALGLLYAITDLDVVPRAGVVFAGQPLNESRWQWKIPVAGPIHRTFRGTFSDEPQRLEEVTVADPELEAESGFDLQLTVKNAGEDVVFEGDSALFASFVFPADGEYTARLTAEKKAGPGSTGHIPEGRYEYDFTFRLNAVPQLELSRESAAQGSVLTLKLTGVLGDTLPRLQADFAPKAVFVQRGRDWVACLDVPYDCPTGSYPVTVTSGENEITREVTVYARQLREIDTQTLDGTALAPFIGALPKGLEPYMEIADPDIYWTDRFVQPVNCFSPAFST